MNNNTTTNNNTTMATLNPMATSALRRYAFRVTIVDASEVFSGVGRHVKCCPSCGGVVTHRKWVKIEGMRGFADNGHARYIGYECFLPLEYHADDTFINVNKDGTNNNSLAA